MVERIALAFVAALAVLNACASSTGPLAPQAPDLQAPAGANQTVGRLLIEPVEIDFKRGTSRPRPVRVWQLGYKGPYTAVNHCIRITVVLRRYAQGHESIWEVGPDGSRRESCTVQFTGSHGPRGTNYLKVRVLR